MKIIETNLNTGDRIVELNKDEFNLIDSLNKLKRIYGEDKEFVIINPENYFGYDLETGKKTVLKKWEINENEEE